MEERVKWSKFCKGRGFLRERWTFPPYNNFTEDRASFYNVFHAFREDCFVTVQLALTRASRVFERYTKHGRFTIDQKISMHEGFCWESTSLRERCEDRVRYACLPFFGVFFELKFFRSRLSNTRVVYKLEPLWLLLTYACVHFGFLMSVIIFYWGDKNANYPIHCRDLKRIHLTFPFWPFTSFPPLQARDVEWLVSRVRNELSKERGRTRFALILM